MHSRDVRASDLDRERAVEFLKAHYAAGRLQHDELALRSDAAYRAVRLSELDWLTSDLPALLQAPRRSRSPVAGILMLAMLLALLVVVPPEVWLGLLALATLFGIFGFFMLAPIAIPIVVIATIVHLVGRARARSRCRRWAGAGFADPGGAAARTPTDRVAGLDRPRAAREYSAIP